MAEQEVRVPIGIPVDSNAGQVADAVGQLRDKIAASKDAVQSALSVWRNLKGNTDAVKAAKDQLKATLEQEKQAISDASLALLKQGTSYHKLTADTKAATAAEDKHKAALAGEKKAAEDATNAAKKLAKSHEDLAKKAKQDGIDKSTARSKQLGAAMSAAGGPASSLSNKLSVLSDVAGGGGASGAMGLAALGAAALAAAVLALAAAIAYGLVSLAKFIIVSADAERSMSLLREAATGSAANAKALGTQIDELADKVPTSKEALNELATSLAKAGVQGQTLVDTFNAVGQASSAMGDQAGAKLREIVERSKLSQRMMVNPLELQGTGITYDDLAKQLAKGTKTGVADARRALMEGRVKLGDGAAALRAAVDAKFGDINLRKMVSLENLAGTLKKKLAGLTSGVNLDPLLERAGKFFALLDDSTVTGQTLKTIVTAFGSGVVDALTKAVPLAEKFLQGLIIGGLQTYVVYLQLKKALTDTFGSADLAKNVDGLTVAMTAGKYAAYGIAAAMLMTAGFVAAAATPFLILGAVVGAVFFGIYTSVKSAYDLIFKTDWKGLGSSIIDGLVAGLKLGGQLLVDSVTGLADSVKGTFKKALRIQSPSKDFFELGEDIPAGAAGGVEKGTAKVQSAVEAMVEMPPAVPGASSGGGGSSGGRSVTMHATFIFQGSATAKDIDEQGLFAKFVELLERANQAAAMPVVR